MRRNRMRNLLFVAACTFIVGGSWVAVSYGESNEETAVSIAKFSESQDIGQERALAQSIGDQYISLGEPDLSSEDVKGDNSAAPALFTEDVKKDLREYIAEQIAATGSPDPKVRVEANEQIQRLWRVSAPELLNNLGHQDPTVNEAVMKNLILMRNEKTVKAIADKIESSTDERVRRSGVFVLGMMNEDRVSKIPNREVVDATETKRIVERVVKPFLRKLSETESASGSRDTEMKAVIENAHKYLDTPVLHPQPPSKRRSE